MSLKTDSEAKGIMFEWILALFHINLLSIIWNYYPQATAAVKVLWILLSKCTNPFTWTLETDSVQGLDGRDNKP